MKMKKKDLIEYIELVILFFVLHFNGFIKYIFFLAWVAFYYLKYKAGIRKELLAIMTPPAICVSIGLILSLISGITTTSLKEAVFHLLPPIGAIVVCKIKVKKSEKFINIMFFAILTIFIATNINKITAVDWMESQYAFAFGLFILYYVFNRKKQMSIVAIVALLLAHKRIAWLAVLLGGIILLIFGRKSKKPQTITPKKTKTTLRVITIFGLITVGVLYTWVYLCKTNSITVLLGKYHVNSSGRTDQWIKLSSLYIFSPYFVGYGLGYVTNVVEKWGISSYMIFHNDILLMYIQLGFIGFAVYFYSYFSVVKYYIKKYALPFETMVFMFAIIVYTFICYLTDNISIYINYLFPYYILIFSSLNNTLSEKKTVRHARKTLHKKLRSY